METALGQCVKTYISNTIFGAAVVVGNRNALIRIQETDENQANYVKVYCQTLDMETSGLLVTIWAWDLSGLHELTLCVSGGFLS